MAADCPAATGRAKVRRTLLTRATAIGAFLLPHWRCWHQAWGPPDPVTPSQWTCLRSGMLLAIACERDGIPATLRSGRPRRAPMGHADARHGLMTVDGWVGHAWVEAENFVIDVTADQFGHAPVVVTPAEDRAYRSAEERTCQLSRLRPALPPWKRSGRSGVRMRIGKDSFHTTGRWTTSRGTHRRDRFGT